MKYTSQIKNALELIFVCLLLQSCNANLAGTWENDHIDKATRTEIKTFNDKLFRAIQSNNIGEIKYMMSDSLRKLADAENFDKSITRVGSVINTDSYSILNEYDVNGTSAGATITIPDSIYTLTFISSSKETYISLLTNNAPDYKLLIAVIYGKYKDGWKINSLQFGEYSMFGKTALDYYQLAKACYAKSYLIDAINYVGISKSCSRPATSLFQYNSENDIIGFQSKLMSEAKTRYPLPLTLQDVNTKPKVFRIEPYMLFGNFLPLVYYLSDIKLTDSVVLKAENKQVEKEVDRVFSGINKDKKYVLYWAFNEIPTDANKIEHHGFIDTLEK